MAEYAGVDLIEMEMTGQGRGRLFQVMIDKEGGVSLDDCADLSRLISTWLDVEGVFDFEYRLEVSSPGIFRALKNDKDFQRHLGDRVKIKLTEPIEGEFTWVGKLKTCGPEELEMAEEGQRIDLIIPRRLIKKVNLEPKL